MFMLQVRMVMKETPGRTDDLFISIEQFFLKTPTANIFTELWHDE